jgi:hypothetical protein
MTTALRGPSARPSLITNSQGGRIGPNGTQVGIDGPLSAERVTTALPLAGGPTLLEPALVLRDAQMSYLADPQGNLIGEHNATWVDRLLPATVTGNTRRL